MESKLHHSTYHRIVFVKDGIVCLVRSYLMGHIAAATRRRFEHCVHEALIMYSHAEYLYIYIYIFREIRFPITFLKHARFVIGSFPPRAQMLA